MTDTPNHRRMTLSDVVTKLLDRTGGEHSSVTLSRNAKGDTQIEVVVRTDDAGNVPTADAAAAAAQTIYDQLRAVYPHSSELTGTGDQS